jgi:hypothetical protein
MRLKNLSDVAIPTIDFCHLICWFGHMDISTYITLHICEHPPLICRKLYEATCRDDPLQLRSHGFDKGLRSYVYSWFNDLDYYMMSNTSYDTMNMDLPRSIGALGGVSQLKFLKEGARSMAFETAMLYGRGDIASALIACYNTNHTIVCHPSLIDYAFVQNILIGNSSIQGILDRDMIRDWKQPADYQYCSSLNKCIMTRTFPYNSATMLGEFINYACIDTIKSRLAEFAVCNMQSLTMRAWARGAEYGWLLQQVVPIEPLLACDIMMMRGVTRVREVAKQFRIAWQPSNRSLYYMVQGTPTRACVQVHAHIIPHCSVHVIDKIRYGCTRSPVCALFYEVLRDTPPMNLLLAVSDMMSAWLQHGHYEVLHGVDVTAIENVAIACKDLLTIEATLVLLPYQSHEGLTFMDARGYPVYAALQTPEGKAILAASTLYIQAWVREYMVS